MIFGAILGKKQKQNQKGPAKGPKLAKRSRKNSYIASQRSKNQRSQLSEREPNFTSFHNSRISEHVMVGLPSEITINDNIFLNDHTRIVIGPHGDLKFKKCHQHIGDHQSYLFSQHYSICTGNNPQDNGTSRKDGETGASKALKSLQTKINITKKKHDAVAQLLGGGFKQIK